VNTLGLHSTVRAALIEYVMGAAETVDLDVVAIFVHGAVVSTPAGVVFAPFPQFVTEWALHESRRRGMSDGFILRREDW